MVSIAFQREAAASGAASAVDLKGNPEPAR
jgi:hypothetical protein